MSIQTPTLVFSAKTANYTSPKISVADAEEISAEFQASGISGGNGIFKLQGSDVDAPGSSDWVDLAFIDNVANTNAQTLARVTSKTLSANGNAMVFLDPHVAKALKWIRMDLAFTTDGSYSGHIFTKRKVAMA